MIIYKFNRSIFSSISNKNKMNSFIDKSIKQKLNYLFNKNKPLTSIFWTNYVLFFFFLISSSVCNRSKNCHDILSFWFSSISYLIDRSYTLKERKKVRRIKTMFIWRPSEIFFSFFSFSFLIIDVISCFILIWIN